MYRRRFWRHPFLSGHAAEILAQPRCRHPPLQQQAGTGYARHLPQHRRYRPAGQTGASGFSTDYAGIGQTLPLAFRLGIGRLRTLQLRQKPEHELQRQQSDQPLLSRPDVQRSHPRTGTGGYRRVYRQILTGQSLRGRLKKFQTAFCIAKPLISIQHLLPTYQPSFPRRLESRTWN